MTGDTRARAARVHPWFVVPARACSPWRVTPRAGRGDLLLEVAPFLSSEVDRPHLDQELVQATAEEIKARADHARISGLVARGLMPEKELQAAKTALTIAESKRLSPILMTALTAGLALVPLILHADAPGNEIQAPMAVVILGGLISSTALNLLVVPPLFLIFGQPAADDGGR